MTIIVKRDYDVGFDAALGVEPPSFLGLCVFSYSAGYLEGQRLKPNAFTLDSVLKFANQMRFDGQNFICVSVRNDLMKIMTITDFIDLASAFESELLPLFFYPCDSFGKPL